MMTSYEVVKRAIEFSGPDRISLYWSTDVERSDILNVGYSPPKSWKPSQKGEDEWGCVWEKIFEKMMGQVTGHPIADWEDYKSYNFPAITLEERFKGLKEKVRWAKEEEKKYVIGHLGHLLFERLHFLRGMDNVFIDLYDPRRREKLGELEDRMVNFHKIMIEAYADCGVDCVAFADDWGCQDRMLVNPDM